MSDSQTRHSTPDERLPTRPLRVLSLSHGALQRLGGRLRYQRAHELRPNVELTVLVPSRWQEYGRPMTCDPLDGSLDLRIEPVRLPTLPKIAWHAHFYPGLAKLLRELQPDVIHAWEEPWSVVGFQITRLRDRLLPNAAVILETDQNILHKLPFPFEQIRRYTLKRIDLLVSRGDDATNVSRACGFDGPAQIVEYALSSDVFFPHERDAARASLGLSGFVIGYVGRLVKEKGLKDVVGAIAACETPVTLVIVGEGPDAQNIASHASALGVSERVKFFPPCSPVDVARFMNALDVLILMSKTTATWKEQFGRVIMEAHACRVPVIGSDSGSIPSVVAQGGWIAPEGDVGALATLLEQVARDPSERERVADLALNQARTRFHIDTVSNALADAWFMAHAERNGKRPGVSRK